MGTQVKRVAFGRSGRQVPAVAAGMMRIAGSTDAEIRELYSAARESGIDFFDHADIYGFDHPGGSGTHHCERRFAQALRLSPSERDEITLQTKVGIRTDPPGYDHSYEHIVAAAEGCLEALGSDYLDVLLLHRPDALVEPDEVARAFDDLEAAGKVRAFGVSNCTAAQLAWFQASVDKQLLANQVQFSLAHAGLVADGICGRGDGLVEHARANGVTLQAWSPLQGERVTFLGDLAYRELNEELARLAAAYSVTPAAIAVAWITRHPANMQVVLGTANAAHLREAAAGAAIELTRDEWYALYRAAGNPLP